MSGLNHQMKLFQRFQQNIATVAWLLVFPVLKRVYKSMLKRMCTSENPTQRTNVHCDIMEWCFKIDNRTQNKCDNNTLLLRLLRINMINSFPTCIWRAKQGWVNECILLYVAFCTLMQYRNRKKPAAETVPYSYFEKLPRVLCSAQYHRQHCILHAFEQFGTQPR